MKGLWIDSDMGADDIFAIEMVRRSYAIDGVSLIFGVANLDQVKRNASGAAAALSWNFPIFAGADRSIIGEIETAQGVLESLDIEPEGASFRNRGFGNCPQRLRNFPNGWS